MLYKIIRKIFIIIAISAIFGNTYVLLEDILYNKTYKESMNVTKITGIVVSSKEEKNYYDKYVLKATIDPIRNKKYIIYVKKGSIQLNYGDKIEFSAKYEEPEEARNYRGFNYKDYLKTKKIYGSYKIDGNIIILNHNTINPLLLFINNFREKIILKTHIILDDNESEILLGLILGRKEGIQEEDIESFKLSGMSHILSVSGMHISYIILGLTYFLKHVPIRKRYIIVLICLLLFMALTNFLPSVVRATIMASMILIAKLFHRKEDFLTSIFLSLLILCLYNPYLINNIGLVLSFLGTLGIAMFSNSISKMLSKKLNNSISNILAVTISAEILILPFLINSYNILSISFFLSGFILAILVAPIFIYGTINILISFISVKVSKIFAQGLKILIKLLLVSAKHISKIKILNMLVKTPNILFIIFYYVIVLLIKYFCFLKSKANFRLYEKKILKKQKAISIKKIAIFLYVLILFFSILFVAYHIIPKSLKLYFIDVGQGDSCLIISPKGKTILIDGGENEDTVFNYLLDRGITKLDYILISHFDSDHVLRNI